MFIDEHYWIQCVADIDVTQIHSIVVQDARRHCGRKLKPMWGRTITHYYV
jgi:hypothetical protein